MKTLICNTVTLRSMYVSIWFGIMLGTQAGCSVFKKDIDPQDAVAEVRRPFETELAGIPVQDTPSQPTIGKQMNRSSSLPKVPPSTVGISYSQVKIDRPVLAMTFDDGPHPSLTPKLLDLLKERNVKATFFLVGRNIKAYPDIVRRIIAEGHEIGNHTWTHASLTTRSDSQIRDELKKSDDALMEVAGYKTHLIRPPYGAINTRIKELMFSEFGLTTIMWSVDPQDWRRPGVSVVTSRLVNGAHNGAIMLSHDIHPPTIQAMPAMFDQLIAKGYQFVTVSQLINLEKSSAPVSMVVRPSLPAGIQDPEPLAIPQ